MLDWAKYTAKVKGSGHLKYLREHECLHLRESISTSTGEVLPTVKNRREFRGLHVTLNEGRLTVMNSLHVFHSGHNTTDFRIAEMHESGERLCEILKVSPNELALHPRFEWGVNIPFNPAFLDRMGTALKGKVFYPIKPGKRHRGQIKGIQAENSTSTLKAYHRPGSDCIRLEMVIHRPDKLCPKIRSLGDLLMKENIHHLNNLFLNMADSITCKPDLRNLPLMKPRILEKVFVVTHPDFQAFLAQLKAHHPATYKKEQGKFKTLIRNLPEPDSLRGDFLSLIHQKVEELTGDDSSPFSQHVNKCGNGGEDTR